MDAVSVPVVFWQLAIRLALAVVCGAAVGLNRELRHKPAGLRTHALVGLGSALVTLVGLLLGVTPIMPDTSAAGRLLQGLLAGIGFIGVGVILRRNDPKGVHNLTTAASIWVVAGIGMAVGAGLWRTAVTAVALSIAVLWLGTAIDDAIESREGGPRITD